MQRVSIRKKVMGREIDLPTQEGYELELNSIVETVNEKFDEADRIYNVADTQKRAAYTAILLAQEVLKLRGSQNNISNNYERKIKSILNDLSDVEKLI
jgi:cell division protein ZapA (FtsZ GTPase activity inhibitor)